MAVKHYHSFQSRNSAVREARNFVHANGFGTLTTINQGDAEFSGYPAGQVEYYSDTGDDDASLLLIRVDMSSAFRNVHMGSTASFAIRTGDGPQRRTPVDIAANHRIILYGEFEDVQPTNSEMKRFFQLHPDARDWAPGRPGFHKTYWTKFIISGIYYIGGFGGEHYIGKLPVDQYKATPVEDELIAEVQRPSLMSLLLSWFGY